MPRRRTVMLALPLLLILGGCEMLGMEDPAKLAAAREADGKAIGGACRHSGRALEDCYLMNPKAQKAAVYAGWRDMDAYMRENQIEVVMPDLTDPPSGSKAGKALAGEPPAEAPKSKTAEGGPKPGAAVSDGSPPGGRRVVG